MHLSYLWLVRQPCHLLLPPVARQDYARKFSTSFRVPLTNSRGAAQYESQDQAFSFQKQVRFEDNNSSPELRPDMKSGGGRSALSLPVIMPRLSNISGILHAPKYSSTPYHTTPKDRTFDIGPSVPLIDESRHTATIATEVLAATAGTGIQGVLQDVRTQDYETQRWVFRRCRIDVQVLEI